MTHHRPTDGARVRAWLFAVLGLLALAGNGLIVQTHRHPLHRSAYSVGAEGAGDLAADTHCTLCDAQALAEPLMPPCAPALLPPIGGRAAACLILRAGVDRRAHTHGWRSRAPPLLALT